MHTIQLCSFTADVSGEDIRGEDFAVAISPEDSCLNFGCLPGLAAPSHPYQRPPLRGLMRLPGVRNYLIQSIGRMFIQYLLYEPNIKQAQIRRDLIPPSFPS
jgi:hypothetical protein